MAWSDFTGILTNIIDKVGSKAFGAAAVFFFVGLVIVGWSYADYVKEVRTKYVTPFESERLRVKLDSCEAREHRAAYEERLEKILEIQKNDLKDVVLMSLQRRIDSLSFAVMQAARDNSTLQNQINRSTNKIKTTIQ